MKPLAQTIPATDTHPVSRVQSVFMDATLVVCASLFVALCAKVTLPLPGTPVPLTIQNFAVLLVGLLLGARRAALALALYLVEGAAGLPVFNPAGLGGVAQLFGPTGGFLLAYPAVAYLSGWLFARNEKTYESAVTAAGFAEIVLFTGGLSWLYLMTHSIALTAGMGLFPFVAAELLKVAVAGGIATGWQRWRQR